jgi:hypothetical protein
MHSRRLFVLFGLILTFSLGFCGAPTFASTPDFAITAANVTMPSSGYGSSQFTVTGFGGAGLLSINCVYSGPATEARIPTCADVISPVPTTSGEDSYTGTITFIPYGAVPPPAAAGLPSETSRSSLLPAAGLALAGALLFGFGLRRKASRWLVITLFAASTLAAVAGISACAGGSSNGMTPGSYPYTVAASFIPGNTNLIIGTSTSINVVVP